MGLLSGLIGSGGATANNGALIKDSAQRFMADVIQASRDQPVIVDFWAPWCGPCKQLTPLLERVVNNAAGKVRLVKINIDENPELAQQLRIQSIPTVYGFRGGQPVDGFAGALPESQIKAFVERLTGPLGPAPPSSRSIKRSRRLRRTDRSRRASSSSCSTREPTRRGAGRARPLPDRGRPPACRARDPRACVQGARQPRRGRRRRAALSLAEEAGTLADPAALNARLAADPNDHEARLDLATVLFLRGQVDAAIEHLLAAVRRDREWRDQAARKQLVKFFEALGPQHPATVSGRRKLSTVLFS